jgi:exonuclease III
MYNLQILQWNCNSIKSKIEFLKSYLSRNEIDMIVLNEIKCTNYQANNIININNYHSNTKTRSSCGGGVSLLIHKKIKSNPIELPNTFDDSEIVGAEISFNNQKMQVFGYYSPDSCLNSSLLLYINSTFNNPLLIGDLNAITSWHKHKNVNTNGRILDNILLNTSLQILNTNREPTFFRNTTSDGITSTKSSLLDLAIGTSKAANMLHKYEIIYDCELISDHKPIKLSFKLKNPEFTEQENLTSKKRNYELAIWPLYHSTLDASLNHSKENLDIEQRAIEIIDQINLAADTAIPTINNNNNMRISSLPRKVLALIQEKNRMLNLVRKMENLGQDTSNQIIFLKALEEQIRKDIQEHKNKSWTKFIRKRPNPLSSKPFWSRIDRLRGKEKKQTIGNLLDENNISYTNDCDKANLFASKLEQTFSETPNPNFNSYLKYEVDNFVLANKYNQKSPTEIPLITKRELSLAIDSLSNKDSPDLHEISNKLLKHLSNNYKEKLLKLFNDILIQKQIPKCWKKACITMIPKQK